MIAKKIERYWTQEKTQKILGDKNLWLTPYKDGEFLHEIEILDDEAKVSKASLKKLFQINHFLRLIEKDVLTLKKNYKKVAVVDLACGKSYLSLAFFYWVQKFHKDLGVELRLVETQEKMVEKVQNKIVKLGWESHVNIYNRSLVDLYEECKNKTEVRFHLCLALHACDQLSDYALGIALESKADFLAIAPCCQAELASIWSKDKTITENYSAQNLWKQEAHFRREAAALITDTLRLQGLRSIGYDVHSNEFVAFEHSAKNRLISGRKLSRYNEKEKEQFKKMLLQCDADSVLIHKIIKNRWEAQNPEIAW